MSQRTEPANELNQDGWSREAAIEWTRQRMEALPEIIRRLERIPLAPTVPQSAKFDPWV